MIFRRILLLVVFSVCAILSYAQTAAIIKASVDKNKILIGEPLQLTIEANLTPEAIKFFNAFDSIQHFEILDKPTLDTTNKDGASLLRAVYKITSFDSGHWVIPSFSLTKKIKTDTIPVDVIFSEFNPEQEYHDIKDIIDAEEEKGEKKNWVWYAVAGTVLMLLLIYFLLKKKKQPALAPAPSLTAFEEAIRQLNSLQGQNLPAKDYHTKLVDIFRLYILKKKNILSLQKTTDNLVVQLRPVINSPEVFSQVQQALRLSDFVKFAKYIPSAEDNQSAYNAIKKTIEHIEQL
jgi:LPXTG-motif cell wall-anchored protein